MYCWQPASLHSHACVRRQNQNQQALFETLPHILRGFQGRNWKAANSQHEICLYRDRKPETETLHLNPKQILTTLCKSTPPEGRAESPQQYGSWASFWSSSCGTRWYDEVSTLRLEADGKCRLYRLGPHEIGSKLPTRGSIL